MLHFHVLSPGNIGYFGLHDTRPGMSGRQVHLPLLPNSQLRPAEPEWMVSVKIQAKTEFAAA